MANRKLIIHLCDQCPYFDNVYFGYNETCRKLHREIPTDDNTASSMKFSHPIPDDCPLEKE